MRSFKADSSTASPLVKIDRSHCFCIKAGIDERMWVFKESALKKVHFYCFLESCESAHKSLMRPNRSIPLPFLSDAGIGLADKIAQLGKHLTTPVSKLGNLFVYTFSWIHC